MKMNLYAVRDIKADTFGAPMSIATDGLALRSFLEACQDSRSELAKYPEDYMLFKVGEYDPNSGVITPLPQPELIISASGILMKYRTERAKIEPELSLNKEAN